MTAPRLHPGFDADTVAHVRDAAHLAKTLLPPELGGLVYDELRDWGGPNGWHRFDVRGRGPKVAAELHQMARDRALERTYG